MFFIFLKILILWVHSGIKGQKLVQNDKKVCLLDSICQKPYIIWLSFMVQMCKMVVSPGVFFHFFKILIFQVVSGVKGQKMVQNDKKICCSRYLRNQRSSDDLHLWYTYMYKRIISPRIFFIFFKILVFGIIRGVLKGQKMTQNDKKFCLSLYI